MEWDGWMNVSSSSSSSVKYIYFPSLREEPWMLDRDKSMRRKKSIRVCEGSVQRETVQR